MGEGKLIFKKESFILTGCAFDVYNSLGYGHHERIYQKAYASELVNKKIDHVREVYQPVFHKNKLVGKYFLDFLVEGKIVVELKVGNQFHDSFSKQVLNYLKSTGKKLGIIFLFTPQGIQFKRLVN